VQNEKMDFLIENSIHELGLGLAHGTNGTANFMSYDQNRTHFTAFQMTQIYYSGINKQLNQGSNIERTIKSSNDWYYNTSTNVALYTKNVQVGGLMPKTIPNP
jgi:hypothetical protein